MAETSKLNPEQLKAVKHKTGPLLIIAGAGTGKTTVITERVKYLISRKLAKPQEILALTFTEKSAKEMEERIDTALPYGYTQMWVMTFHSFCDRILRSEALHIGLDPRYKLMTESEAIQLIRSNLFDFDLNYFRPLGNPNKFISGLLQHFSRLQDEDLTSGQYGQWADRKLKGKKHSEEEKIEIVKWKELASAFKEYEELKIKNNVMDFGDLITKTLKLFRERKNILETYKKKFKYILVDEFQDTNVAQNELIKLLAGRKGNITVVADDDQCLPSNSLVSTPTGNKLIKKIKPGDEVITAVGKGYLSISKILNVNKSKKKAKFIVFTTELGKKLRITENHKMFCMIPGRKFESSGIYYIYLMFRSGMGWRIGITDDLSQRLKLERSADKIIAIKSCNSLEEARFFETVYSMKYQIPTYPFKPRRRMILTGIWLKRIFSEFDTQRGAEKLSHNLGIDLDSHHYTLAAVIRGNKERVKVVLKLCSRRHRTKWARDRFMLSPKVLHGVSMETSSKTVKKILDNAGVEVVKTKNGWKVAKMFTGLDEAGKFAKRLTDLVGGFFEAKIDVGKRSKYSRSALIMPAGNIFPGMYVPVRRNHEVVYERLIDRQEQIKTETVYDLEVERTHNFIADDVVVHNSIYRFRGAAVSNVLAFRKDFPKSKIIVLTKNYRSTQEILDRAHDLIENNNPDRLEVVEKINKKLTSARKERGQEIGFIHTDRVENEAEEVAKVIKNLKEKEKYDWKDFAILVRANNHADPFARAMQRHAIPFQFLGPGRLFKQPEIIDLVSYLKVLYNFDDSPSFYRLLCVDYFGISGRDLAAIGNYARRYNLSLFGAAEKIDDLFVSDKTKEKVKLLLEIIKKHLDLAKKESAGQILYYFLQDTGLIQKLLSPDTAEAQKKASNISKLFDKLKTYEVDHEDASVAAVVDWIDLASEIGESPRAADTDWGEINAVNILTVHSAKGLEFPVVFLVNLVSQRFPTTERHEQIPIPEELIKEILPKGDYHLEEERRLFYVGMTRAKDNLYLAAADYYGEGKREKKLSPFIFEALGDKSISAEQDLGKVEQLSFLDYKPLVTTQASVEKLPIHIDYLSYSQIETFKTCPLHYKLKYLLKVPTPPSAAQSFGIAIHASLKDFYVAIKNGSKPTEKLLNQLLEKNWIKEGFSSKSHEKKFFEKGKVYLSGFLKQEFTPKILPVLLEEGFTLPIRNHLYSPSTNSGRPLKVGGKIDRVDLLPDGSIEIWDYKTGATIPSQKDVDKNLQLSFYALAATTIPTKPFGVKPEKIKLSLYFLDQQEKISTTRTAADLEKAKTEILKIKEEIENSDFTCSGNFLCKNCEYKLICNSED